MHFGFFDNLQKPLISLYIYIYLFIYIYVCVVIQCEPILIHLFISLNML